jgi:hypothetical protein
MAPQTTSSRIITLVFLVTIVTIGDSYIPHELSLVRGLMSFIILGLMAIIVAVTVRAVLRDF